MRGIIEALRLSREASRFHTAVFAALTLLAALVPVVTAWLTKLLLDALTTAADSGPVLGLGAALAVAGLLTGLVPHVTRFASAENERRVGLLAQERLFIVTERFVGMSRFEDPVFLDRMRMALQHGGATPGVVVSGVLSVTGAVITGLGFLGSLLVVSPWMPVLVLASAVPVLATEMRLARRRASLHWRLSPVERREMFYRNLLTDPQAAKEIRLFGVGAYLRGRMSAQRRRSDAENRRMDLRQMRAQALTGLLGAAVAGGALLWAVLGAVAGRITLGDVSLLVAAVAGVQAAGLALVRGVSDSHRQLLLFGHYRQVTSAGSDLPVAARPRPVAPLRQGIVFRDVWFRYAPDGPWVLRGVDLTIPHGRTVGLVGRNGAGKSTLIKLLCRMYDPERGAVLWDGTDLRDLDPAELRARIGAVFQDYMEYDLTAAENIGLGDLSRLRDADRITAAAEDAGAHGFVTGLPRSYDTLLSRIFFQGDDAEGAAGGTGEEAGVALSGGQWQRLALARAHLRAESDLMILDEPSSGLDAEAEYRIHRTLRERRAGRTNVLISHRLNTVREADVLIVLDDGVVAERGGHGELMALGGIYADLFRMQAEGYAEPQDPAADILELLRRKAGL
ncbi:ABC transporter ATP-binding protein [Planomonospora parontospora]|uniref:ABC transporter ATP-binding protein n=1 Tax=Planomonospora parontospora TaxID=58119 RepID=UPI00166FBD85|nr:ABC transporter ATP-binding protein [Planomonospora parontospora]GGL37673.1 multidrug ABC transporter permease [Planomonospora parontospora subsp. antibiotica]GII17558.1 multidrug ABC transporter permease [Planomonospora parontospora subsp. antibiotica]